MSTSTQAKAPVAAPAATLVAIVLAIGLVALGVVFGRDALVQGDAMTGTPWTKTAFDYVDGLTAQTWMMPAGVAVAILGLLLLFAAVKPRKRTHRPLDVADAWLSTGDVTRVAQSAAERITGVSAATATGSRRTVTVTVVPSGGFDRDELTTAVDAAVGNAFSILSTPPRLKTRIKEETPR